MSYYRYSPKLQKEFTRLQQELLQCYRDRFDAISVSSLALEYEIPWHEIYVRPTMVTLDLQRRFGNPTKTRVASLTDMFFRPAREYGGDDREDFDHVRDNNGAYKNIYVIADAGMGKTAFSKMICMAWCKAHDPVTSLDVKFQCEEIEALKKFYFLFYISLRDVDSSFCDLDDIITELLKDYLPRKLNSKFLEEVFNAKPCLIILDGIDEWRHPDSCTRPHHADDVPHRKCRRNWSILSTTRPWKFDFLRLASYQLDCHIDIKELDDRSLKQLVSNVVNLLNKNLPKGRPRKSVDDFYKTTSLTMLGEIRQFPYICLHCVCLWFEGKNIGDSKCEIYTNLIELTMKRGIQKIRPGSLPNLTQSSSEGIVPKCMVNAHAQNCIQHLLLLQKLGKLALYTILGMEDKRCVIFEVEVATKYINQQELEYSVKTGILSQTKGYGSVARRISLVSFHHKSIQEYLAAFYLQSCVCNESLAVDAKVQDVLDRGLGSILSILNMSNLFIFLSGLNSYAFKEIAARTMNRVSADESTCKYRKSVTSGSWPEYEVMLKYQTLQVTCAQEMKANGQEFCAAPLEDIFINGFSNQEQYITTLQDIIHGNRGNIKSLSVRAKGTPIEIRNILGGFDLKYFCSLEKLELCDVTLKQQNLEQLLVQSVNTLRCLSLHHTVRRASLSTACEGTLLNMQLLQALSLEGLTLSHDQLEHVTTFISSSFTIIQIHMSYIDCSDHNQGCPGAVMHLTQEKLQQLTLQHVPVSHLHLNPNNLEDCNIGQLPTTVVSSWLSCLPAAKSLRILSCREFAVSEIATLTGIIPSLQQLEQIFIHGTDLGERGITLAPEMIRLEYVELCAVSLTSLAVTGLLGAASLLPSSVRIALLDCTVTPENEYETIKEGVRRSGNFAILHDGPDNLGNPEFTFKILK